MVIWLESELLTSGRRLGIPAQSGVCILAQMQGENCLRYLFLEVSLSPVRANFDAAAAARRAARERRDLVTQMPPRKHATLSIKCAPPCRTHFEYSNFISKYYAHNVTPLSLSTTQ